MKRTTRTIIWLLCLLPTWLMAQNNGVHISPSGGVYAEPFPVTLACDNPDLTIRFTLNGAVPNGKSALYSEPLMLNNGLKSRSDIYKIPISPKNEFHLPDSVSKGIVIRAAAFDSKGNRVSPVVTQSYFIGSLGCNVHGLPVVSICADSLSLFARDTGILVPGKLFDPSHADLPGNYSQHGREWERTANVEFYDTGNEGFNQTAGLRTHGGPITRRAQQKGLKIYARKEYGEKNFSFKIFEETDLCKFKHLVFRPFNNACTPAGMQDWLSNRIAAPLNMGVTASRPVALFLNGEYWGIYFIEEKADERYLESYYDVDRDLVNIIDQWGKLENGTIDSFHALYYSLADADLTDSAQYSHFAELIDIPNIIDYYLFELFSANTDWPINNVRCWQSPDGLWHWVFYDGDWCLTYANFDVYGNATFTGELSWPTSAWSTLFFRKLLENPTFKNQFLLRLEQLNKTVFNYQQTKPYYDKIYQLLKDEIPNQMHRFGIPESVAQWEENSQIINLFLSGRVEQFWQQTAEFFHLRNDKVLSATCNRNHTSFGKGLVLTITAEESCTALMEIRDSKGRTLHHEYVFLQQGENQMPLKLGKRWGTYVVKVGDATCEVTKISYTILIIIFILILAAIVLIFLKIKRKRASLLLLCLLLPSWLLAQNNDVQISHKGGAYPSAFPVTLTCSNPALHIRYTLNGAVPDGNSALYSEPLMLSNSLKSRSDIYKILIAPESEFYLPDSVIKGIVIRAAAFDNNGNRVSPVTTRSYFISALGCDVHGLPIVSICADSLSLFAHDTGILVPGDLYDPDHIDLPGNYSQHGREWERTVNVEYYDMENEGFNQTAGLRTHGGATTRRAQQKGLKIYAREDYGKKNFDFKIFEETDIDKFKRLVLRPFNNACTPAGIQDWLSNHIAAPLNMGVTASRPVALFLNGEYWGIYFIEEKVDERYLESHYGVDHDLVNIIAQWAELENGTSDGFYSLYYSLMDADLSDSAQYSHYAELIDIPNIIDYYLFELFSANRDWPVNNVRCWQYPGGPWHWVFYDGDWCLTYPDFDVYGNATFTGEFSWPTSEWSTLFFRKLLESETFKRQFLVRLDQLNKTCFSYRNTKKLFSQIRLLLDDEIQQQSQRFNNPQNIREWNRYCQYINEFLAERVVRFQLMTNRFFDVPDSMITSVALYPNPLPQGERLNLLVKSEQYENCEVVVYDMNGETLQFQYLWMNIGTNYASLDLRLPAGTYIVKVGPEKKKLVITNR